MSVFGKLDAANIKTNPFFIEKGVYHAEVTNGQIKTNRDNQRQLVIEYTINEADSAYNDKKISHYFTLPAEDMTQEDYELLSPEERQKLDNILSAMKRTLCGNDANASQKGLGVSEDDLNDESWNPATLIGTKVMLAIRNYGEKNEGVGIHWVNLQQD